MVLTTKSQFQSIGFRSVFFLWGKSEPRERLAGVVRCVNNSSVVAGSVRAHIAILNISHLSFSKNAHQNTCK